MAADDEAVIAYARSLMTKATARPWRTDEDEPGKVVGACHDPDNVCSSDPDNAAAIVLAINAMRPLLDLLAKFTGADYPFCPCCARCVQGLDEALPAISGGVYGPRPAEDHTDDCLIRSALVVLERERTR